MKSFIALAILMCICLNEANAVDIGCSAKDGYIDNLQSNCSFGQIQALPTSNSYNESNIIQATLKESSDLLKDPNQWSDLPWVQTITVCEDPMMDNAYADSVSSKIVLGYRLLQATYTYADNVAVAQTMGLTFGKDAVTAVFFHEFAHHFQFLVMQKMFPVYLPIGTNVVDVKKVELEADAISAAFLKARFGMDEKEADAIELVFSSLGSSDFKNPKFHGYPYERRWAARIAGMGNVDQWKPITRSMLTNIHNAIFVNPLPSSILPGNVGTSVNNAVQAINFLLHDAQQDDALAKTSKSLQRFASLKMPEFEGQPAPNSYFTIFYGGGIVSSNDAESVYTSLKEVGAAETLWTNQDHLNQIDYMVDTKNDQRFREINTHLKRARSALQEFGASHSASTGYSTVLRAPKQMEISESVKQREPLLILSPRTIVVNPDQPSIIFPLEGGLQLSTGRIEGTKLECIVSVAAQDPPITNTVQSASLESGSSKQFRWKGRSYALHLDDFDPKDRTATLSLTRN